MGIAKKGKRKLVHDGDDYFWWVEDDFEGHTGHSLIVTVSSEDKKFLVKYYIDQRDRFVVTVLGARFCANIETGRVWKRFSSPQFGNTGMFTPKDVVSLIRWSLSSSVKKIEVDYQGKVVANA